MRPPRAALLALLLLGAGLAGCTGEDDGEGPGATTVSQEAPAWTTFLCTDGYRSAEDVPKGRDRCNHRVTKPLEDPTRMDVVRQHGPANEVSIAVNPLDPLQVAGGAKDYTVSYVSDVAQCGEYTVWMGTFWSDDGGITWGNDLMPGFPGDPRASPLSGNHCNTDPVLAWDDDGTLWYHALNYEGGREDAPLAVPNPLGTHDLFTGSQLYFARSDDGGASYPEITFAAVGDDTTIFNDKNWMAVQPRGEHMIATWSMFTPAGPVIHYTESFDQGRTWGPMTPMPLGQTRNLLSVQFSMPQYLPEEAPTDLAVIWADFSGSNVRGGLGVQETAQVAYTEGVLDPAGTVFAPPRAVCDMNPLQSGEGRDGTGPTAFRLSTYPVLAVDTSDGPFQGRRYVVWADQEGGLDTDTQIKLCSSDDGITWTEGITVNDVPDGDQFMPWIDVDPHGTVHAAWYDRRNDPENRLLDVYYATSQDGGATWSPALRVTETSFDGDLSHHQNGGPFIGDYIGLDTTGLSAHILWADTRHTGEPGREQGSDVYSATILKGPQSTSVFDAALDTGSDTSSG